MEPVEAEEYPAEIERVHEKKKKHWLKMEETS